ncbi:DUF3108 domain-containing protein, partial [Burkholderia multivorans]|nr:DUF3108 domain-containing protein [Burkholderia multivorans]
MPHADTRPRPASLRHWRRVGVALVVALVLHALAALWLARNRESFTPPPPADVPVQVELLKTQPIERAPAPQPPAHAAPKPAAPEPPAPKPAPAAAQEQVLTSTQTDAHGAPPA